MHLTFFLLDLTATNMFMGFAGADLEAVNLDGYLLSVDTLVLTDANPHSLRAPVVPILLV